LQVRETEFGSAFFSRFRLGRRLLHEKNNTCVPYSRGLLVACKFSRTARACSPRFPASVVLAMQEALRQSGSRRFAGRLVESERDARRRGNDIACAFLRHRRKTSPQVRKVAVHRRKRTLVPV